MQRARQVLWNEQALAQRPRSTKCHLNPRPKEGSCMPNTPKSRSGGVMSTEIKCQVRQRVEKWPYLAACKEVATHITKPNLRSELDGIEFVCNDHARECIEGFGPEAATRFEYYHDGDTFRTRLVSSPETSTENQSTDSGTTSSVG